MLSLKASISGAASRSYSPGAACLDPNYTSDFTADADGWSGNSAVTGILFNQDGVGGLDDNAAVRFTDGGSLPDVNGTISKTLSTGFTVGCTYNYLIRYRVPAANDEVTHITALRVALNNISIDSSAVATDTWIERTGTFTANNTSGGVNINFNADHDTGAQDQVYINEIKIYA